MTHLTLESGVGAMEADLDLARMASLCLARLAAVLPKMPGLGDRLRVLTKLENVRSLILSSIIGSQLGWAGR